MPKQTNRRASTPREGFRELGAMLVVLPLATVIWLLFSGVKKEHPPVTASEAASNAEAEFEPRMELQPARFEQPAEQRPKTKPDFSLASAHSEFKPGDPSHPMSPERLRAYRQNDFIGQIDGAILVKDYEGIRRLNAEYRREYPDDDQMTREAYDMIADCLENNTPERVATAREFWETKRGSRARRDLRKICLE
jgi:hypothetical protein